MYGNDDSTSQANSLLLTSLLAEALANSNNQPNTTAPTSNTTSFFQANGIPSNLLTNSLAPTTTMPTSNIPPQSLLFNQITTQPNDVANQFLMNQATLNQMILLNSALQQDILRLSHDTGTFHLNDDGSESSRSTTAGPTTNLVEKPLDLTTRKLPSFANMEPSTSSPRPSVIKNSFPPKPPSGVKRSTSSLSYRTTPDVSDHFRRSLSGKWPRRPANYSHYSVNNGNRLDSTPTSWQSSAASTAVTSPTTPRRQFLGSNSCVSQIVINEGQVEDHFRRTFELLRQNTTDSRSKESPSPTTTRL